MDRVVKCNSNQCGKHFMYTKEDTKCPFCHTEHSEAKKITIKTQKESFKVWKSI